MPGLNLKQRIHAFLHPPMQENNAYHPSQRFKTYIENDTQLSCPAKLYIENRILDQIDWYNDKSSKNQKHFKKWMVTSILLSACIPILTLFSDIKCAIRIKVAITAISSAITVISAIISLYHFQDLWVQYRANCEILQSILHRYLTKTGEFRNATEDDALNLLVMSCEEYMTKEFQTWVASNTPRPENQSSSSESSTNS